MPGPLDFGNSLYYRVLPESLLYQSLKDSRSRSLEMEEEVLDRLRSCAPALKVQLDKEDVLYALFPQGYTSPSFTETTIMSSFAGIPYSVLNTSETSLFLSPETLFRATSWKEAIETIPEQIYQTVIQFCIDSLCVAPSSFDKIAFSAADLTDHGFWLIHTNPKESKFPEQLMLNLARAPEPEFVSAYLSVFGTQQ